MLSFLNRRKESESPAETIQRLVTSRNTWNVRRCYMLFQQPSCFFSVITCFFLLALKKRTSLEFQNDCLRLSYFVYLFIVYITLIFFLRLNIIHVSVPNFSFFRSNNFIVKKLWYLLNL